MPITPFHLGAGALLHALVPRRVSFIAFAVANVITDCETVVNVLRDSFPWHRFLHTFLGAHLVIALTVVSFLVARRVAKPELIPDWFGWRQLALPPVILGAMLGAYSHIVFDGIMHADVRPFAPWSEANPFLHAVPLGWLHIACLVAAVAGVALVLLKSKVKPHG